MFGLVIFAGVILWNVYRHDSDVIDVCGQNASILYWWHVCFTIFSQFCYVVASIIYFVKRFKVGLDNASKFIQEKYTKLYVKTVSTGFLALFASLLVIGGDAILIRATSSHPLYINQNYLTTIIIAYAACAWLNVSKVKINLSIDSEE
jgi:hypothetical protein